MSKRSIRADLVDFLYIGENDGFAGKSEKYWDCTQISTGLLPKLSNLSPNETALMTVLLF